MNIGYIEAPRDSSWRGSGGDAYRQMLLEVLHRRYQVEPMGAVLGRGNKFINSAKLAYRLLWLKGEKDIWLRDFMSTVTLPFDRTRGKNLLLVHHIDSAYLSYPALNNLLEKIFYRNLKRIDVVVTVSKYWKEHFENRGHNNVRTIYNPFILDEFKFNDEEIADFRHRHGLINKQIIYIGNCQKSKGVVESYQALKDLDVHLVTSGKRRVSIPAINLDLSYRDYLCLLKASSAVVAMSKFKEGWNRTVHEAMLCKTPVIGSGMGGMRELLEGGHQIICGDFSRLRQDAQYVLEHPELGQKGYDFAKNFTVDRFESEWVKLIEEMQGKLLR